MKIMDLFGGSNVIIRTVTNYYTGRLVGRAGDMFVIEDAAWIVDTGRWAEFLETGNLDQAEPYPNGPVLVGGVIDMSIWTHPLPRTQK
jgi:hypothetical protein